ncbi:MAG TPA: DUF2510 domain-containing protein [Acidimicrobiales bacterium]
MNAPTAGWNPDPTGRHEYRYWDGSRWTDDVSDNGVTAVDPVAGGTGPGGPGIPDGAGADPTTPVDRTQQFAPQPGGFGPQPGGFGPHPGGYDPMTGSGQVPPARPARSGPSTGLIVGLAALAVALIAGIAFVVAGGDDDGDGETSTEDISTQDSSTDDTASGDTSGDTGDATGDDLGLGAIDDPDGIVDLIATGIELQGDGAITHDQAVCAAQAMVDHFGLDNLMEMSTSGSDPFADASIEDQAALVELMTDCIPAEVLAEIGMSQDGG